MFVDPLRGKFTNIGTDGLVMPALAAASIRIVDQHANGFFSRQNVMPATTTTGFLLWLSAFSITSYVVFSYSFLHRCRARSRSMLLFALLGSCVITTYLLAFYLVMTHRFMSYTAILTTFFIISFVYQAILYRLRSLRFANHQETVLILGTGREAQKMWKHIRIECDRLVAFKGFVGGASVENAAPDILARTVCTIGSLNQYLQTNVIDTLVLTANGSTDLKFAKESVRIAQECGVRLLCSNEIYDDVSDERSTQSIHQRYVDFERVSVFQHICQTIKTLADRVLAGSIIVLLTPVALPLLLVYWFILGDSPFVSQSAYGYHRHSFTLWDIRTMASNDSVYNTSSQFLPHRLASFRKQLAWKIGQFLLISGLDHAPHLWSVCTGDMSLVGPTPIARNTSFLRDTCRSLRRYAVRPGLCWPEPSCPGLLSSSTHIEEDRTLSYLRHWNLLLDWKTLRYWAFSRVRRLHHAFVSVLLTNMNSMSDPTPRAR